LVFTRRKNTPDGHSPPLQTAGGMQQETLIPERDLSFGFQR
jgi:hypothetical protein